MVLTVAKGHRSDGAREAVDDPTSNRDLDKKFMKDPRRPSPR